MSNNAQQEEERSSKRAKGAPVSPHEVKYVPHTATGVPPVVYDVINGLIEDYLNKDGLARFKMGEISKMLLFEYGSQMRVNRLRFRFEEVFDAYRREGWQVKHVESNEDIDFDEGDYDTLIFKKNTTASLGINR